MTAYHYSDLLVWNSLGGYTRPAAGVRSTSIVNPLTALTPTLTQGGITVLFVVADANGRVTFTADCDVVRADFGVGPDIMYSDERLTATSDAAPALAAAATAQAGVDEITTGTLGSFQIDATKATALLAKASNLSDLVSASTARGNLGLGGAATLAVGTTAGTVAAGNDGRFGSGGSVSWATVFAAPLGGGADDKPALQAAVNAFASTNGGLLLLQPGTYLLRSQLKIPNKVTVRGQGRSVTVLQADAAYFPASTPVIRLGDGIVGLAFETRVEHLTIECSSIVGSIGIYSNEIQEMCGPSFVVITGFKLYGIQYEGNCANTEVDNCEIYPAAAGATYGIWTNISLGENFIRRCTVGVNGLLTAGVRIQAGSCNVIGVHIENCTDGVLFAGSDGAIIGVSGPSSLTNVTNLVRVDGSSRYVAVMGISKNGATNAVVSDFFGITIADSFVQSAVVGDQYVARLRHVGDTAGFFGHVPVAKPTAVAVTAAGVHAALVTLGLIS